jgi:Uma2 family endonuclease
MATALASPEASDDTLADLLNRIGNVPLERIRRQPAPGTATEADVVAGLEAVDKRLYELVDGVLVEKVMSTKEGLLAGVILYFIWGFLRQNDLGLALPGDSAVRLRIGLVRIPDVSFISWDRLPKDELPDEAIASVIPDLGVEVISKSNTKKEMERKLEDYFRSGVRLVWFTYPNTQTARIYTSPTKFKRIDKDQDLTGGDVLPGFNLPLRELFAHGKRHATRR